MAMQDYTGSCQCGAVSYEVKVDLTSAITCNCSRCQRLGWVPSFTPRQNFTLKSGEEALTEYLFNHRSISHRFCKICGIEAFAYGEMPDGSKVVAINANCLDGVDPRALKVSHVDGASA